MTSTAARPESLVGSFLRTWDRFWFTPADPTTLSFIRLCTGLLVLYVHITYSWDLFAYIGRDAWVDHEVAGFILRDTPQYHVPFDWSVPFQPIETPALKAGNFYWSIYYHLTDPRWIVAVHVGFGVAMLLFALGLWTRPMALVTWVGAMAYVQRANSTVFGMDTMMMIVLLYLLLGPCGDTLSLDRWRLKRRARRTGEPEPPVPHTVAANFAVRLIQVHFCVVYLASGTTKLLGSTWWAGTALNLVMLNPSFAPMDNDYYFNLVKYLASNRPLWEVLMWAGILATLALEIAFCMLVWIPRYRWIMICSSVLLHAFIGVCMGLVSFSLMMMIFVSSFIPPSVIRAGLHTAGAFVRGFFVSKQPEPVAAA